jgi:Bifunctional DNA primase/polymerase, N-terminal
MQLIRQVYYYPIWICHRAIICACGGVFDMSTIPLQAIADDYASHGLGVYPALPKSKEPAGSWKAFQWQPPSESEREALFSINCNLNIGVICGAASNNLAALDCETPRAFEETLRRVERAGYGETWTVATRRSGHVHLHLPVPVKPVGKIDDVELRVTDRELGGRRNRRSSRKCSRHQLRLRVHRH